MEMKILGKMGMIMRKKRKKMVMKSMTMKKMREEKIMMTRRIVRNENSIRMEGN